MHGLEAAGRAQPTLTDALRFGLRELCAAWAREQTVFRHLIGLAAVDPQAREVIQRHDQRWRRGIDRFAYDLNAAGLLRPGWSPQRAGAILHLLFSFETFDRLQANGNTTADDVADTLIALAGTHVNL